MKRLGFLGLLGLLGFPGFLAPLASGCDNELEQAQLAPPPDLDDIERVVIVADNSASNPAYSWSFVSLLMNNDDAVFAEFAGHDLATRLPGVELIRLDRGGDSYHALAAQGEPLCTCGSPCSDAGACVDTSDQRPALVIVSLGLNDILDAIVRIVLDGGLVSDPKPLFDGLRAQVASLIAFLDDPAVFPVRPLIVLVDPYEPSDGVGDLGVLAKMFYPTLNISSLTPELVGSFLDEFSKILLEEAKNGGAVVVDVRSHFRGHGYHFADASLPDHDPADATTWMQHLFDPTPRGAHEIRRVLWKQLTGEDISALPGPLPPDDELTLPVVSDTGWASAVTEDKLTLEFIDDKDRSWSNVADDPMVALGPPELSTTGSVAVGIVGASLTLDLGAGEEATDGPGADLVVMEYAAMAGGAPEPYRVLVSDAPEGPFVPLADGRGERAFDFALSGVTSARYVRIESQAHIVDVTSGFGSALFPGPEVDAIGAVHLPAPTP